MNLKKRGVVKQCSAELFLFTFSAFSGASYYWKTITNQVSWHHPLGKP